MTNLTDTRRGGFYWQGKTPYLSVTEILKVLDKPALRYWFGQQIYYAMLKDPTLGEQEAMSAPWKVSDKAKSRGTTVHSIVEAYKHTGQQIDTIPDDFKGYATAFYKFMNEVKPEIIEQEKTVFIDSIKVAGTLDLYMKIGDNLHLVDTKTGKDIYKEVELQLSPYAYGMRLTGKKVDSISALLLETGKDNKPTGNYKFQTMTERYDEFLACKKIYEWTHEEKLLKIGYLTK